ncbi:MAG: DUF3999 domain-containing protein [Treponema sp.]|jgi:hypothetical protein|nr:DUF3999 domain-containing protein [Treponema sp.]
MKIKPNAFSRRFAALLLGLCAAAAPLSAEEQRVPGPGDFGATLEISVREGGPAPEGSLMVLEVPETVYRRAERRDLGDLRVFDAKGVPVPFLIRPVPPVRYTPPPQELPFFVWKESGPPREADIEINAAGAVIRISGANARSGDAGTPPGTTPPESYILELRELPYVPVRLILDFEEGNFSSPAELFFAEKLGQWRGAGVQTLARYLSSGGGRVEQKVLELRGAEDSYLLISIRGSAPGLKSITAEFETLTLPGKISESRVQGRLAENRREALFDAGAFYPLRSVDFALSGPDFLNVEISSRFSESEDWRYETSGLLYMFTNEGRARRNKPFALSSTAPFWRLSLSGEVPFASPPELILSWEARELIFLARGGGPWTLAYGNADIGPSPDLLSPEAIQGELVEASVSGAEQYRGRQGTGIPRERAYQPWLLWGSLVASVLVLTGLAVYIGWSMRKMSSKFCKD